MCFTDEQKPAGFTMAMATDEFSFLADIYLYQSVWDGLDAVVYYGELQNCLFFSSRSDVCLSKHHYEWHEWTSFFLFFFFPVYFSVHTSLMHGTQNCIHMEILEALKESCWRFVSAALWTLCPQARSLLSSLPVKTITANNRCRTSCVPEQLSRYRPQLHPRKITSELSALQLG